MGTITKDTFKRLFLLYLIGEFKDGSYGKTRLEKITYFIERELKEKPFEYKWHHYGQYSEELSDILEQLISIGQVNSLPLDNEMGNKYTSTVKDMHLKYENVIDNFGGLKELIKKTIDDWGYKSEPEIIAKAYSFKESQGLKLGQVVFEENLPSEITLENIDEDQCEDLELAFNPNFMSSMEKIVRAVEETPDFDIGKIKKIDSFT